METGPGTLAERLAERLVGQSRAIESLVPYLEMHRAGLSPEGRPAGVFLLLGPSGTGKTRTVEVLAELLHGSARRLIRIDCGEFQADHEVAKLLGAPPGYVGHRESEPVLTAKRLADATSPECGLSLVLFDEIEKAAPSLSMALLGILDKATLRLGDGSTVDFENSLIFLTSNLGARRMLRELQPGLGFRSAPAEPAALGARLQNIGLAAVRRRFAPEFVNRIDAVVTYEPLDADALLAVLDQHLSDLQHHLDRRLAERSFHLHVTGAGRDFLVAAGTSPEYGARELRRAVQRHLSHPLAVLVAAGQVPPGAEVTADLAADGSALTIRVGPVRARRAAPAAKTVLVVDDNEALAGWLEAYLSDAGLRVLRAGNIGEARACAGETALHAAFVDHALPDGDGLELAAQLTPRAERVVLMTGAPLSESEMATCRHFGLAVLRKPFPGTQLLDLISAAPRIAPVRMAS